MTMTDIPVDLRAEALLNYLPKGGRTLRVCGSHKRNAYEDLASLSEEEEDGGRATVVAVARNGLYDLLPECLFHPVDRFENLPANDYKERFRDEYDSQRAEEADARRFFELFDRCLMELGCVVAAAKDRCADNSALTDIICGTMPKAYCGNRFVERAREFLPYCKSLRGNYPLLTLMLRKVLFDEGITLVASQAVTAHCDRQPGYDCRLDGAVLDDTYLGNSYDEPVATYTVGYWSDDECSADFLRFTDELKVFESFVNDYFVGIEERVSFRVGTTALPVRLADDVYHNYLGYNTNL